MMRGTPRTFVGSVVLLLDTSVGDLVAATVRDEVAAIPGVGSCNLDEGAGALVVTARSPVDRTDVDAVLDRLGCRVRA
jgi:hypothetical protein